MYLVERSGPRPGYEPTLVESDEGLPVYRHGADPLTARWGANFTDDERREAREEPGATRG